MGVITGSVGLEPFGMLKHIRLLHDNFSLDSQMTTLAEGGNIPPLAVRGIDIQVVNGKAVAGHRVVRLSTSYAFPSRVLLDL